MKKGVEYLRYSCDRQTEQSIEGQIRVCDEFAAKNGIEIVKRYQDHAMTGTNDNRPAFQQMLEDSSKSVEWDIVLVYAIDRFGRNAIEIALNKQRLKKNGKTLISATQRTSDNIDGTKNLDGILLENMYIGLAEYYSAELSQKTKRGMNETRMKGNFIGGYINYGWSLNPIYRYENGKQILVSTKVILNEEEAPIVKEIFTNYATGKKITDIARDLNARDIKNRGNPFLRTMICFMLHQEKYTGIYRVNGIAYDKIYPPIVPIETYKLVQARLESNKHGRHVQNDVPYLLKSKVFCGYCGRRMVSFTGTSKSGKINRYYRCPKKEACVQRRTVKKDVLEQAIIMGLEKMLCYGDNYYLLLDKVIDAYNSKLNDLTDLHIAEKELAKTEKSLANLIAAIEAGLLTETTRLRLNELEQTKRELKEKIAIEKTKELPTISREDIQKYFAYAITQPSQTMIDLLIDKVVVKADGVEMYLKYTQNMPPDKPKKKLEDDIQNPDENCSYQGFYFMEFTYSYKLSHIGRKSHTTEDKPYETASMDVKVFI